MGPLYACPSTPLPIVGIVFWKLGRDDFKDSAFAVRFMELVSGRNKHALCLPNRNCVELPPTVLELLGQKLRWVAPGGAVRDIYWIGLAQNIVQWRDFLLAVLNLRVLLPELVI
jgi:hypothetical protein